MRLVVTGGAGYIGSVCTAVLLRAGHGVTVVDDLSEGHEDAVPAGARFVRAGLTDRAALEPVLRGCDGVLHFAAKALVAESVAHPERYWDSNVRGSLALLEAMRAAGVRRIVFSSTCATYGQPDEVPIPETTPTRPTNPYGASKLAVDLMLTGYAEAYGLAATSLRYFNVAGADGDLGERHGVETHLIPLILQVAAGRRPHVEIYGTDYPTPDGTAIRDYIHVVDLSQAHVLALEAAQPGRHAIYNLGNGRGFSVREVVEAARQVTGRDIPTVDRARRPGDPAQLVAASRRIVEDLGWTPQHPDLEDMIGDAWAFAQRREAPAGR